MYIDTDDSRRAALAAQTAWFEQAVKQTEQSALGVLDGRLAGIARTAQAEQERIRVETISSPRRPRRWRWRSARRCSPPRASASSPWR